MAESFGSRFKNAWDVFTNRDTNPTLGTTIDIGSGYTRRNDQRRTTTVRYKDVVNTIYTQLGIDIAAVNVRHVRLDDDNERFIGYVDSGLNECLSVSANIDQTGRAFMQDAAMTMCQEGHVAIVAVETDFSPLITGGYQVRQLRAGVVTEWYPQHVRVKVYNEKNGMQEEVTLPKASVAICENPLFSVMNEPNSNLQRLTRKLSLLDSADEQAGSGKLDMIIQLPYTIRTDKKREEAETRRKDIEFQLSGSKYGIAYADGSERITQLNRPVENNLLKHVEYLTSMVYSELGLTDAVFKGTADEATMVNYFNRTIEPMISAISDSLHRTFLTKTARKQHQAVRFFRDPFKLVPIGSIAEIADKFTRNEIMSANEMRGVIGLRPSKDPKADELRNSNISRAKDESLANEEPIGEEYEEVEEPEYITYNTADYEQ